MTVEQNAQATLRLLCQLPPNESGETAIQGGAIQQRLGLMPNDLNDAVSYLEQKGLVTTFKLVGTGVFSFYTVSPTVAGRAAVDSSLEKDAERIARLPAFQRRDPTTGEISLTAVRVRDLAELDVVRTNWAVELLKRSGYAAVNTGPGTKPFTFRDMTLTPAGRSYVNRLAGQVRDTGPPAPAGRANAARNLRIVAHTEAREQARGDVEAAIVALVAMDGTGFEKDLVSTLLAPQLQRIVAALDVESVDPQTLLRAKDDVHNALRLLRVAWPVFPRNKKDSVGRALETAITSTGQALVSG